MTIDLDDAVTLTTQVHDMAGNLVQAAGASPAITLTLTDPAGGTTSPAVTLDTPSLTYSATFTVPTPGLWSYEWQTFGTYRGVDPGQFLVESHDPTEGSDTLGTLEGWQTWRGQPFTNEELPRAMMMLRTAGSLLITETGYTFTEVIGGTYVADGGRRVIFLPQWPITGVTSVEFEGVDSSSWEYLPTIGAIRSTGIWIGFPLGHQNITITYDYGYADMSPLVQSLVYMIASRLYANPTGDLVQSETIGSYSVSYAPPGTAGGLTETEAGDRGEPRMAYSGLLTRQATIIHRGDGAPDEYGDTTPAWLAAGPYPCELQQLTADELGGRVVEETLWRVFLPSGVDLTGLDHILIEGQKYEATGDANHVYNPRTRREHHVELEVRHVS